MTQEQIHGFAQWLKKEERSSETIEKYLRDVTAFGVWLNGECVAKEAVAKWKAELVAQGYGTLPAPTRTGYEFTGWYTAQSGGSKVTGSDAATTAGDHTLYAQWEIETYTISYTGIADSSISEDEVTTSYTVDGKTFALPKPTKDGYSFTEWTCSNEAVTIEWDEATNSYTVTIPAGTTGDMTITADWKQNGIALLDPDNNKLYELVGADDGANVTSLPDTITYNEATAVVAYWVDRNDVHYCNGTTMEGITGGATTLTAVIMSAHTPMEINSVTQLERIKTEVDNGTSAWIRGNYKLVDDVTLNASWTSGIGAKYYFKGTFDGNEKTITYGSGAAPIAHPHVYLHQ